MFLYSSLWHRVCEWELGEGGGALLSSSNALVKYCCGSTIARNPPVY